jgi:hypothetical protein
MRVLLAGCVLWAGVAHAADVTVRLTAAMPSSAFQAKAVVGEMFRAIGVDVGWNGRGGVEIEIHLSADTPDRLRPGALAVSYPYGSGSAVTVFYDRLLRLAEKSGTPERMLLAHVLAHEIAHVLERIDRHSDSGIMKAQWTREDLAEMARHPLPFDVEDVDLIRLGLGKSRS